MAIDPIAGDTLPVQPGQETGAVRPGAVPEAEQENGLANQETDRVEISAEAQAANDQAQAAPADNTTAAETENEENGVAPESQNQAEPSGEQDNQAQADEGGAASPEDFLTREGTV